MKKLRILALVLVIALCVGVFAACGSSSKLEKLDELTFAEVYKTGLESKDEAGYKTVASTTMPKDEMSTLGYGWYYWNTLVEPENASSYETVTVYNLNAGKSVTTVKEANLRDAEFINGGKLFYITTNIDGIMKTAIYDMYANLLETIAGSYDNDVTFIGQDYFKILNTVYSIDDDMKVSVVGTVPALNASPITSDSVIAGDYIVNAGNDRVSYYKLSDFTYVTSYEFIGYADDVDVHVLSDGKLLAQYEFEVDPLSTEYDVFNEWNKLNFVQYIFDPATGEAEEIDLGGAVMMSLNKNSWDDSAGMMTPYDFEEVFVDTVKDVLAIAPITEGKLDDASMVYAVYDSAEGKVTGKLPSIEGATGLALPLSNDLYYGSNVLGNCYLLNADGTTKAQVDPTYVYSLSGIGFWNQNVDGMIYKKDMSVFLNWRELALKGAEWVASDNSTYVIYSIEETVNGVDVTNYYKVDANGTTKITAADGSSVSGVSSIGGGAYKVTYRSGEYPYTYSYKYFAADGTALTIGDGTQSYSVKYGNSDFVILSSSKWDDENSKYVYSYYKLSK